MIRTIEEFIHSLFIYFVKNQSILLMRFYNFNAFFKLKVLLFYCCLARNTNENFTSDPDFLFESKSIPEMEIFVRKMNFQISDLLENRFLLRFLYKFSNADNAENVADKDQMLEELTGFSNAYEDIYMGKLLDSIRNCLSSKYFCGLCLKTFKKTEEILPHMSAFHKSFVSNESVEELRNSRDARRRQESEDQMRTRHNNNHPQCQTCFVSPE